MPEDGTAQVGGGPGAGPRRLIEKKIRLTSGQIDRFRTYLRAHEGKREADAWRDIINAGLGVLLGTAGKAAA